VDLIPACTADPPLLPVLAVRGLPEMTLLAEGLRRGGIPGINLSELTKRGIPEQKEALPGAIA